MSTAPNFMFIYYWAAAHTLVAAWVGRLQGE